MINFKRLTITEILVAITIIGLLFGSYMPGSAFEYIRQRNVAVNITFPMVYSNNGTFVTGAAGLDSEVSYSNTSAGNFTNFTDCAGEAIEIGTNGIYQLNLAQAETNHLWAIIQIKSSTTNATTQVLPMAFTIGNFTNLSTTDDGSAINVTSGAIDTATNILQIGSTTQTARDLGASVLISPGTGTGQLNVTTGRIKSDVVYWNGTALPTSSTAGIPDVNIKNINNAAVSNTTAQLGVNVIQVGGTTQTAKDIGAIQIYSGGNVSIGTNTTITSVSGAVGSVTGAVASVTGNLGGNVTGNVNGNVNGTVASVTGNVGGNVVGSVASVTGAVGSVTGNLGGNVTGNVNGNVNGSVGSVLGNIGGNVSGSVASLTTNNDKTGYSLSNTQAFNMTGNITGNLSGSVGSVTNDVGITQAGADKAWGTTTRALTDKADFTLASGEYTNIWNKDISGYSTSGYAGTYLKSAGGAADPWLTNLPGEYSAGTAGYIIGHNIDATISSRGTSTLDAAGVWGYATRVLSAGTNISLAKGTGVTGFNDIAATDVWAAAARTLTAGSNISLAKGTGITGFNDIAATDVWNATSRTLSDFGFNVTVNTNNDKTGYTAATVQDKTGYSLSSSQAFNMAGNITGNLTGSVGSVTNGVTITTNNDKTGYRLSATGIDDIWDETQTGHNVSASFGLYLDSKVSEAGGGGLTVQDIVDGVWDENSGNHTLTNSTGKKLNEMPTPYDIGP